MLFFSTFSFLKTPDCWDGTESISFNQNWNNLHLFIFIYLFLYLFVVKTNKASNALKTNSKQQKLSSVETGEKKKVQYLEMIFQKNFRWSRRRRRERWGVLLSDNAARDTREVVQPLLTSSVLSSLLPAPRLLTGKVMLEPSGEIIELIIPILPPLLLLYSVVLA